MKGSGEVLRFTFNPVGCQSALHTISIDDEKEIERMHASGRIALFRQSSNHARMTPWYNAPALQVFSHVNISMATTPG